jgi:hypothetical protein
MVYDAARKEIILHGGDVSCGGTQTWAFNGTTATWTLKATTTGTDTGYGPWLAYDATRSAVVLWNKAGSTWEWNGTAWSTVSTAVTPVSDTRMTPPYYYGGMTYDAARGQLVGAGGYTYYYDPILGYYTSYYAGTWLRTGTTWSEVTTFVQPSYRSRAAAAYDPLRGKVVLFGGQESCSYCVSAGFSSGKNDTWEWDGRKWTQISATNSPSVRGGAWADYNSSTKTTMLFGGDNYSVSANGSTSTRSWYADLYSYNGSAWSVPSLSTGRAGLKNPAMAYDAANNRIVTFGGAIGSTGTSVNDTYTWSSTTGWVLQNLTTKPAARRGHVMGYDPLRQRVVMVGGVGINGNLIGDTWEWSGTGWSQNTTTGPSGRKGSALVFNPDLGKMNLYGNNIQGAGEEDLWEYGATGWTQRLLDMPPYPNYRGATAYDAARHQLVIYGGKNSWDTALLRYRSNVTTEACTFSTLDYDNDGAAGCADVDCWSVCTPLCPPGSAAGCTNTGSRCGDGTCNADLEDSDICPSDCAFTGTIRCGDRRCSSPTETITSCPIDCVN